MALDFFNRPKLGDAYVAQCASAAAREQTWAFQSQIDRQCAWIGGHARLNPLQSGPPADGCRIGPERGIRSEFDVYTKHYI
jgi:hypothetical protein